MSYDNQNIFARILRGELPCELLYEDDYTVAFLDLFPQADGHTLVVTREPAVTLLDVSPEGAAHCIATAQKLAIALKKAMAVPAIMLAQFSGAEAGQTVPHLHFHLIPRTSPGMLRPHAAQMEQASTLKVIAERIRAAL
jgi:histidine triad (HIT) family protein